VCTRETGFPVNHQARLLDLGPHWDVLDEMQMGIPFTRNGQGHPSAAIARLALRPEHAEGTASFSAHPALLDIATGFGLPVLDGYKDHGDFYVPLIYEGARFYAPLPNEVVSRMVCRDRTSRELASFEVTLWDRDGRCVAEIDTFTMKRVDPDQFTGSVPERRDEAAASTTNSSSGMALDMTQALTTKEGLAVLDRVLAHDCGPQVLVSTVNIDSLKRQIDEEYARPDASSLDGEENTEPAADNAPRDPVETQIAAIWASMLGVAHVGIHDDFFDLGGHSLIAVRVFARVKKEFGVDLPLSTILQAPTVAAYAEIVRQAKGLAFAPDAPGDAAGTVDRSSAASPGTRASGDGTSSAGAHADVEVGDTNRSSPPTVSVTSAFNPLVPIHTRGDGVPFFCVHGAGGGVLNFRDLAQHLKDRPFYGLQARGINGQFDPHTSIEDMAAEYVAAVRRAHPEGPYVLGGYSGGGVIAYEMAQQLLADGVEVPLLVFLDTFYPHLSSPRTDSLSSRLGERIEELRKNGWAFIADYIRTRIKVERNRILRVGTRLYDRLGRSLPIAFREQVLVEAFHAAVNSYEPRYYPGQIVMFGAEDKGDYDGRVGDDLGWSAATGVEVTVYKIPGDHDNLVLPPNTERLARLLGRELRGAVEPTEVLEHQGAY
jgi:thioesterase domain-containing protein/acyl carrier protein